MTSSNNAENPDKSQPKDDSNRPEQLFGAVGTVASQLIAIEQFMARRFDEISMEINATSQQVDMAEEGIINRFAEVLEVMKAISYSGDGTTPANAGVELDAVVDMTEKAANTILDAADQISSKIGDLQNSDDEDLKKKAAEEINKNIEEIFMACSFQDVTGQRIRNTLENLKMIEERLGKALSKMGIEIETNAAPPEFKKSNTQDDIDSLFDD